MRCFFVEDALDAGRTLHLPPELQHRLSKVLRLNAGAVVGVWNGRDGLWEAAINDAKARTVVLQKQLRPQPPRCRLMLALCVPKREAWESALRQATELGVTDIVPLLSAHCVPTKINTERARQIVREAAEQCEVLAMPVLHEPCRLAAWLADLTTPVAWAYERLDKHVKGTSSQPPPCLLVGPEGGFDAAEVTSLQQHPQVHPLSLGDTILRVDTAVVAGLVVLRQGFTPYA
jgi:16S rRNA (uracil1498-N3)-methyltransferase